MRKLPPRERLTLSVDTSDEGEAQAWVHFARQMGIRFVKFGLEYSTAASWKECAKLAQLHGRDWVADAKLRGTRDTVATAIKNIINLPLRPFGITVDGWNSEQALRIAQQEAGNTIVFAVSELSDKDEAETLRRTGLTRAELILRIGITAREAGVRGITCSPRDVERLKLDSRTDRLFALTTGIRSEGVEHHDQVNVDTPRNALKNGADLLVLGREITQAADPFLAYQAVVSDLDIIQDY